MADSISYRIPKHGVVKLQGTFTEIEDPSLFNGFLISDFSGQTFYGLKDDQFRSAKSENKKLPIVQSKSNYLEKVEELVAQLKSGSAKKVIYSRTKKVSDCKTTPNELFEELINNYPNAFCYCIDSESIGRWVGASPEKLITLENEQGSTISLAGTKKANDDSDWGEKEIIEQQIVTDYISELLQKNTSEIIQHECKELLAGPVKHLSTQFNFKLQPQKLFQFLANYHPTPAVCGLPKEKAMELIGKLESHNRSFYAGIIGVRQLAQTDLFVNLRCCQFIERDCYLYLGGGITKDSIPEKEWEETENKALTILNLLEFT